VPYDIQSDRYDKTLRRSSGIIGPGSKVAEVLPELFPMFDVENMPPELFLLGGTFLSFGGGSITGAAGESPRAQLFNPPGSDKLVTITSVFVRASGQTIIRWGLLAVASGTAIGTQTLRDTRNLAPTAPIAQVRQQSSVALAGATGQTGVLVDRPFHLEDKNGIVVLAPGTGFEVGLSLVASTMTYVFYWHERTALESELNLP